MLSPATPSVESEQRNCEAVWTLWMASSAELCPLRKAGPGPARVDVKPSLLRPSAF